MKWWSAACVLVSLACFGQHKAPPSYSHTAKGTSAQRKLPSSTAKPVKGPGQDSNVVAHQQRDLIQTEHMSAPHPAPKTQTRAVATQKPVKPHSQQQSVQFAYQRPKQDGGVHLGKSKNSPRSGVTSGAHSR